MPYGTRTIPKPLAFIKNKTMFNFFEMIPSKDKYLKIESDRISESIKFIKENEIDKIYISRVFGYKLDDIKPLLELEGIKGFEYQESGNKVSLKGIESFSQLEHLRIDDDQNVDLSKFPNLKYLIIKWSNKIENFDSCDKLEQLFLWNFNSTEKSFIQFPLLNGLTELELNFGNATTLDELLLSNSVKKLEFNYYPKLNTIKKLGEFSALQSIKFSNCKNIEDFQALTNLKNLKSLSINNCGSLKDIEFIRDMNNLTQFIFVDTNIINGDLSPLTDDRFEYIGFNDKRHYSHNYEELKPLKK
jgi:hypothetical protein